MAKVTGLSLDMDMDFVFPISPFNGPWEESNSLRSALADGGGGQGETPMKYADRSFCRSVKPVVLMMGKQDYSVRDAFTVTLIFAAAQHVWGILLYPTDNDNRLSIQHLLLIFDTGTPRRKSSVVFLRFAMDFKTCFASDSHTISDAMPDAQICHILGQTLIFASIRHTVRLLVTSASLVVLLTVNNDKAR